MRLIKCDRCTAIFPAEAARTELRIFDVPGGELVFAPTETKELCPVCRGDLDNWLDETTTVESTDVSSGSLAVSESTRPVHGRVETTARCQDCTRTFRLTDTAAIEQHELEHGHVVTILDREEDAS